MRQILLRVCNFHTLLLLLHPVNEQHSEAILSGCREKQILRPSGFWIFYNAQGSTFTVSAAKGKKREFPSYIVPHLLTFYHQKFWANILSHHWNATTLSVNRLRLRLWLLMHTQKCCSLLMDWCKLCEFYTKNGAVICGDWLNISFMWLSEHLCHLKESQACKG